MLQMDVGDPVYVVVYVVYVVVVVVLIVLVLIVVVEGGNEADAPPVEALPHFV
jgi:hypothetical protein